jgi:hypothetical protein
MAKVRVVPALLRLVAERANGCCEYCRGQEAFAPQPFSVEHVVPRSRGGSSSEENLAWSCQGCNNHKYTRTEAPDPIDGAMAPLFNPRTHRWADHFIWSSDTTQMIGLSPIGRATVVALRLNRDGLVNLRRILFNEGLHPPAELE